MTVDWADSMTTDDLAALVTTRNYYLNAPTSEQHQIRRQVTQFLSQRFLEAETAPFLTAPTAIERALL